MRQLLAPGSTWQTPRAWRAARFWCYRYTQTWWGTAAVSVLYPTIYLAAMGIGLGGLIAHNLRGSDMRALGGVSYLAFVAPGLLAANSMRIGTMSAMWPVFNAMRTGSIYDTQLATPLAVRDILHGHVCYVALELAFTSAIFLGVIAAFGGVLSPEALFALPAAILVGLACAIPLFAITPRLKRTAAYYSIQRMIIMPMFLFSGVFFSISRLPRWMQLLAEVTPLYHGVQLCRAATLGTLESVSMMGSALYLVAVSAVGLVVARWTFWRRLAR